MHVNENGSAVDGPDRSTRGVSRLLGNVWRAFGQGAPGDMAASTDGSGSMEGSDEEYALRATPYSLDFVQDEI
jgi:hypothetical protein